MPIEISWYIPLRVIRAHIYGEITAKDLTTFPTKGRQCTFSGITPVHCLLDDADAMPPRFTIRQFHDLLKFRMQEGERIGWVIGVGQTNMLANVMIPLLTKTMGLRFKRVYTMEDAIAFLKQEDPTIEAYMAQMEERV